MRRRSRWKSRKMWSSPTPMHACMLSRFSRIQLFATSWTVARQAPLPMGFSRQEHWSGLPFPPPGHLPEPGIKPASLASPALAGGVFTTSATWEAPVLLQRSNTHKKNLPPGLPWWLSGKESTCQCRRCKRLGFDPWVRKISWRRKWQPTPVFLPGESHGQRSLAGYSPWSHKESGKTEVTLHARSRRKTSSKPGFWETKIIFKNT